jgi:hypothetical protein
MPKKKGKKGAFVPSTLLKHLLLGTTKVTRFELRACAYNLPLEPGSQPLTPVLS